MWYHQLGSGMPLRVVTKDLERNQQNQNKIEPLLQLDLWNLELGKQIQHQNGPPFITQNPPPSPSPSPKPHIVFKIKIQQPLRDVIWLTG